MKKLLYLLLLAGSQNLWGQAKANLKVSQNNIVAAAKTYSPVEMLSIANSISGSVSDLSLKNTDVLSAIGTYPSLDKIIEQRISDGISGGEGPKEYGVTYWSGPVLSAYNKYILPNVATFLELNEEIYEGTDYKKKIVHAIIAQLNLLADNTNTYTSMAARFKLGKEILAEFANETFPEESESQNYYRDHLENIYNRTASSLTYCFGTYQNDQNGNSAPCYDDQTASFFMMNSFAARNNCAIAVIIAKSKINTEKVQSKLSIGLQSAKGGYLYMPLTEYKKQSSAFDIYTMDVKFLQNLTLAGKLYQVYDPYYKCPSPIAFGLSSKKIRSASVFNSLK
jgi:hypothetical protein